MLAYLNYVVLDEDWVDIHKDISALSNGKAQLFFHGRQPATYTCLEGAYASVNMRVGGYGLLSTLAGCNATCFGRYLVALDGAHDLCLQTDSTFDSFKGLVVRSSSVFFC